MTKLHIVIRNPKSQTTFMVKLSWSVLGQKSHELGLPFAEHSLVMQVSLAPLKVLAAVCSLVPWFLSSVVASVTLRRHYPFSGVYP